MSYSELPLFSSQKLKNWKKSSDKRSLISGGKKLSLSPDNTEIIGYRQFTGSNEWIEYYRVKRTYDIEADMKKVAFGDGQNRFSALRRSGYSNSLSNCHTINYAVPQINEMPAFRSRGLDNWQQTSDKRSIISGGKKLSISPDNTEIIGYRQFPGSDEWLEYYRIKRTHNIEADMEKVAFGDGQNRFSALRRPGHLEGLNESALRDHVVSIIHKLKINEKSIKLYHDKYGRNGVEYKAGDIGFIDILAINDDGNLIVFELKLGKAPDKAIGQVCRYMGWVKENLSEGKEVYGIILAKEMDNKIKYASSIHPNIDLYIYNWSETNFNLEKYQ